MNEFSQILKIEEWKFRAEKIGATRLRLLEENLPFSTIARRIVDEMIDIRFDAESGTTEAKNKKRAEFVFRLDPEILDVFFNGRQGFRARYYLDPQRGIDGSRLVIGMLKERLIDAARNTSQKSMTIEQVEKSLGYESAKIWIDEDSSTLNQTSRNIEEILALEVPRWVSSMRKVLGAWQAGQQPDPTIVRRALLGVQAPEGEYMKVLGAWLDSNDSEYVVLSKINRATQIHDYGFS